MPFAIDIPWLSESFSGLGVCRSVYCLELSFLLILSVAFSALSVWLRSEEREPIKSNVQMNMSRGGTGECTNQCAQIAFLTQLGCRVTVLVTWQRCLAGLEDIFWRAENE